MAALDLPLVLQLTPWVSTNSPSIRAPARSEELLRLHILISAWCARRRNNLEMTAARRRDLHVAVNPGRWADHALRLGEFVAEWSRTATAHRWRLALDIGRACRPFLGRRIPGRSWRWRTICRSDADERCNDQDGGTQRQLLADLRSVLFQRVGALNVPEMWQRRARERAVTRKIVAVF